MIAPGFESHQCLAGMWTRRLICHAGCQEVGRFCTRGESQGMCNVTCRPLLSSNKAEPTLALKTRRDITRSPKQGYQWSHKKDSCPPKNFKKTNKKKTCTKKRQDITVDEPVRQSGRKSRVKHDYKELSEGTVKSRKKQKRDIRKQVPVPGLGPSTERQWSEQIITRNRLQRESKLNHGVVNIKHGSWE